MSLYEHDTIRALMVDRYCDDPERWSERGWSALCVAIGAVDSDSEQSKTAQHVDEYLNSGAIYD